MSNSTIIVNNNVLGEDSLKGGYFASGNLIPNGIFAVKPNFYTYKKPTATSNDSLVLTLEKVKNSLKKQINSKNSNQEIVDDISVEKYLYETIKLLIDYSDMRNYVFYGSANTELAYNLNFLTQNYPYKFLIESVKDSAKEITIENNLGTTEILVFKSFIKEGLENFNFLDTNTNFNWLNYNLIDKNGKEYPIQKVYTPYNEVDLGNSIKKFTIERELISGIPQNIQIDDEIFIQIPSNNFQNNELVSIRGSKYIPDDEYYFKDFSGLYKLASKFDENSIIVARELISNDLDFGMIRKFPISENLVEDYKIKFFIKGNFVRENLLSYGEDKLSIVVSPNDKIINDFEFNLTELQKFLLSPEEINPTIWPRENITKNIVSDINNQDFINWIQNENLLYKPNLTQEDEIYYGTLLSEYNLLRAISLDESYTNQLIRRCVPEDMISEFNDADNGYFQRFILITGWFFDQIKNYIKFVKYTHHLNYTNFNQLSPEYYKYYASHYGMDLFSDDDIDFSSLVVKTEKGIAFNKTTGDSNFYEQTYQQLQHEKQKRFLLGLFYLYRAKGTLGTLKSLVSLLGAPENLFVLNEFSLEVSNNGFADENGEILLENKMVIDNEKVYVPTSTFEIDTDFQKANPKSPIIYRKKLSNENLMNLRGIDAITNPNGAIDFQINDYFSKQKYFYSDLPTGSLINESEDFYLPVLKLPKNSFSVTLEYMFPNDCFIKNKENSKAEILKIFKSVNFNDEFVTLKLDSYQETEFISIENDETDLVIRANFNESGETNKFRALILKNFFINDGLNHLIKFQFRFEGVEIYKDYSGLGLTKEKLINFIPWLNISTLPDFNTIPNALVDKLRLVDSTNYSLLNYLTYPKELFYLLNSEGYASNVTKEKYFNIKIGNFYRGLKHFYLKSFSLIDSYAADDFNGANNYDLTNSFSSRTYSFELKNYSDGICASDIFHGFYNSFNPEIDFSDEYEVNFYTNSEKVYLIQDFFAQKKIFENNAYQFELKKQKEYEDFNGQINLLYNLYGKNILTYNSLSGFLNLIEKKFRPLIENFIPIVVNIYNFGRLIKESEFSLPKVKYENVEKLCKINNLTPNYIQIDFNNILLPGNYAFNLTLNGVLEQKYFIHTDNTKIESIYEINTWIISLGLVSNVVGQVLIIKLGNTYTAGNVNIVDTFSNLSIHFQYFIFNLMATQIDNCGSIKYITLEKLDEKIYIFTTPENQLPYIYQTNEAEPLPKLYIKTKNE